MRLNFSTSLYRRGYTMAKKSTLCAQKHSLGCFEKLQGVHHGKQIKTQSWRRINDTITHEYLLHVSFFTINPFNLKQHHYTAMQSVPEKGKNVPLIKQMLTL